MKKPNIIIRLLAIVLCLLMAGCAPEIPHKGLPEIELLSLFEKYDDALVLVQALNVDAKLVNAEQIYTEIHGEIYENVINFRFEVPNNYEEFYVIRCGEVGCEGGPRPIKTIGEEVISYFGMGLEAIDIDTITIDTSDALDIATRFGHFEFHSEMDLLSLVLSRDFDSGTLIWEITNSSRYSDGGTHYSSVTIDPTNGNVLSVAP